MSWPPNTPAPHFEARAYQERQDEDQLRLLTLFHYIVGGVTALAACTLLIYVVIGISMLTNPDLWRPDPNWKDDTEQVSGTFFTTVGGVGVLVGWVTGALTAYAGKCLQKRRSSTFIRVMAVLNCCSLPFGTALGIFSLVVLSRPSVKARFAPR